MTTCTRRLCFSAGHRVYGHEGGCAHPHGHNYVVLLEAHGNLDVCGRVIDFSVLKSIVGGWLDSTWDHAFLFWVDDPEMNTLFAEHYEWKHAALPLNPTAENLASIILEVSNAMLKDYCVTVQKVRVEETENCSAECHLSRQ